MIAGVYWDWVWTALTVWLLVSLVPLGIGLALVCLFGIFLGSARLLDWQQARARAKKRLKAERAKQ
jgi:hypothetical protein